MRAVTVTRPGNAGVLETADRERPTAGPGQVLVRVGAAGVNYMDIYQRAGTAPLPTPFVAGVEGAGEVVAVGQGVTDPAKGRRVAWLSGGQGSYAEYVAVDAAKAVPVPDSIPTELAAAVLLQGVTAQYLATDAYRVRDGDTVLVHAAAGGVGLLLTQVVRLRGGRVIGTVSTPEKAGAARAAGAQRDHHLRRLRRQGPRPHRRRGRSGCL